MGKLAFAATDRRSQHGHPPGGELAGKSYVRNACGIDQGRLIPPYTDGYAGAAPDLGAFESEQPVWTAGATTTEAAWDACPAVLPEPEPPGPGAGGSGGTGGSGGDGTSGAGSAGAPSGGSAQAGSAGSSEGGAGTGASSSVPPDAGDGPPAPPGGHDGCGCRLPAGGDSNLKALAVLAFAAFRLRRRQR